MKSSGSSCFSSRSGSSAVSLGILLGIFMGGMCLGSLLLPRFVSARHHPLRVYALPRARHRRLRRGRAVRGAADRRRLHDDRRHGAGEPLPAGDRRRHLPAAADDPDGRDAAGDRALGRGDAVRRVVARLFLRRQHRGRGHRMPARGLLPAPRVRHADRDVRRRGAQRAGGAARVRHRARDRLTCRPPPGAARRAVARSRGSSTWRSRCRV